MKPKHINVGDRFVTPKHLAYIVLARFDDNRYLIQFDESGSVQQVTSFAITHSNIRDYSMDKYKGVGFAFGTLEDPVITRTDAFKQWTSILQRCYGNRRKAYCNVCVNIQWLDFRKFETWYNNEVKPYRDNPENKNIVFVIDKDLFSESGNREYSESNCCVLPQPINSALKNVRWLNGRVLGLTNAKVKTLRNLISQYKPLLSPRVVNQLEKIITNINNQQ
ncbi:MAG: hypothetical protein HDR88_10585 [Bacteroides sp.]|nr:hypothetical protein [Bacteroides sp.]